MSLDSLPEELLELICKLASLQADDLTQFAEAYPRVRQIAASVRENLPAQEPPATLRLGGAQIFLMNLFGSVVLPRTLGDWHRNRELELHPELD